MKRTTFLILLFSYLLSAGTILAQQTPWIRHYDRNNGGVNENIYDLRQDKFGLIWITTYGGLYSYDGQRFVFHKGSTVKPQVAGYHWQPKTALERLSYMVEDEQRKLNHNNERLLCSLNDRDGNLWIGSSDGLWFLRRKEFPFHFIDFNEEVLCLFLSRKGDLWATTREGSICLLDKSLRPKAWLTRAGEWSKTKTHSGLVVMNIMENDDGYLWLSARYGGLIRLQLKGQDISSGFQMMTILDDGTSSGGLHALTNVYSTCLDAQSRIWVASLKTGLGMVTSLNPTIPDDIIHFNTLRKRAGQTLLSNRFRCFLPMYADEWLAGTDNGLYYIKPSSWKSNKAGICKLLTPHNSDNTTEFSVQCLLCDHRGYLYAGMSGNGLLLSSHTADISRLSDYRILSKESDNLPSDVVYALTEDKNHNVWGFCDSGIFRVEFDSMGNITATDSIMMPTIANYSGEEASPWPAMSIGNGLQMPDGRILKGTRKGLLWFYADSVGTRLTKHKLYVEAQYQYDGKDTMIIPKDTLVLPKGIKTCSLYCSVLDFNRESKVIYAYRTVNVDSSWTYTTNPVIALHELPSGYSEIEIRATNGDGVWSGNERCLTVYVESDEYGMVVLIIGLTALLAAAMYLLGQRTSKPKDDGKIPNTMKPILDNIPTKDTVDEEFRNELQKQIKIHLDDSEFGPDQLAKCMGLSKKNLLAKVKSAYGTVPVDIISRMRIQAATELLTKTRLTISEVAYRTGFNDPKYFSRVYKKLTGMSPSEARNSKS